jgi:hypothetical protein
MPIRRARRTLAEAIGVERCRRRREESTMNDLSTEGAGRLAGMIASGQVTSAEVVDAIWPASTRSTRMSTR